MSDVAESLTSLAPQNTDEFPKSRSQVLSTRLKAVPAATANTTLTAVLFLILFVPPVVMAIISVWAGITGVRALWQAVQLLESWQVGSVGTLLPSLDAASRLAMLGVSFFAVLFAFIVFMGGTFGRGWRHLFLIPAFVLAAPSLVVFVQSARMTSVLLTHLGVGQAIQIAIFAYLLVDALLLSFVLTDVSPRRRLRGRRAAARNSRSLGRDRTNSGRRPPISKPLDLERISELPMVPFDLSSPFEVETPASSEKAAEAETTETHSEVLV